MKNLEWYQLEDSSKVISPSLLVYPDRIEKNIELMLEIAGGPTYLRPHIKTHKIAEIVKLQLKYGITKFKCATIAEAELLAQCSAPDILLAMPLVGPNINRFINLMIKYPDSMFSTLVDNSKILQDINELAYSQKLTVSLWIDINNGMHRTGIPVGESAVELYKEICAKKNTNAKGLHAYDGHIRNENIVDRKNECDTALNPVLELKDKLSELGLGSVELVAGGSPSFPIHSKRLKIDSSPGTTLLWDERYATLFKEMNFLTAAVLVTRIISKPNENLLCLDLGHKSIAPEMEFPRMKIFGLENCEQVGQSEEHLVIECSNAKDYEVGDLFYAIPMHICPTVAKYEEVLTVKNNTITGSWQVAARNQKITI